MAESNFPPSPPYLIITTFKQKVVGAGWFLAAAIMPIMCDFFPTTAGLALILLFLVSVLLDAHAHTSCQVIRSKSSGPKKSGDCLLPGLLLATMFPVFHVEVLLPLHFM